MNKQSPGVDRSRGCEEERTGEEEVGHMNKITACVEAVIGTLNMATGCLAQC